MRTAVLRVVMDDGHLTTDAWENGIERLKRGGLDVVATASTDLQASRREVELVVDEFVPSDTGTYVEKCAQAFETTARADVVTYVSRGTDEDARGVLEAFDLSGEVVREVIGDEELVTVTLEPGGLHRVPESRIHTALEAALNCEVRIVT